MIKARLGRLIRAIERKIKSNDKLKTVFFEALYKANKIHRQQRKDRDKLYSWHAQEVECIGKGKVDKPYEFGCKVSLTTNIKTVPGGYYITHKTFTRSSLRRTCFKSSP